jgi:hypothetical protein
MEVIRKQNGEELNMSPNNGLVRASVQQNNRINGLSEEMKVLEYRIKRITSTGIEHYPVLKISQISTDLKGGDDDFKGPGGRTTELEFIKDENILDIVEDNPLNCVLYANDKMGKIKISIQGIHTADDPTTKSCALPSDFRYLISENF